MITFSSWVYRTNVQMCDIFIQLRENSNQVKKNQFCNLQRVCGGGVQVHRQGDRVVGVWGPGGIAWRWNIFLFHLIFFCFIKYFSQVGREKGTDVVRVRVNPKFYRPTEVEQLLGDPRKANEKLKWKPKVTNNPHPIPIHKEVSSILELQMIHQFSESRRRPLLGPSACGKHLLALSHLRHY